MKLSADKHCLFCVGVLNLMNICNSSYDNGIENIIYSNIKDLSNLWSRDQNCCTGLRFKTKFTLNIVAEASL